MKMSEIRTYLWEAALPESPAAALTPTRIRSLLKLPYSIGEKGRSSAMLLPALASVVLLLGHLPSVSSRPADRHLFVQRDVLSDDQLGFPTLVDPDGQQLASSTAGWVKWLSVFGWGEGSLKLLVSALCPGSSAAFCVEQTHLASLP